MRHSEAPALVAALGLSGRMQGRLGEGYSTQKWALSLLPCLFLTGLFQGRNETGNVQNVFHTLGHKAHSFGK